MRDTAPLGGWDSAVAAYLTTRHAFGRAYRKEEWILGRVRAFLVHRSVNDLDPASFERWRSYFGQRSPNTRVVYERTVYNFCRYRRRTEPDCFLPDAASLTRPGPHPLPTIIEREQITHLLAYVGTLSPEPRSLLRPAVVRLAIVLLYTAGLRRGELARLTLGDVDARSGVLRIRESKFHKSRWVPLSGSARAELRTYLRARHGARLDSRAGAPLLCTQAGRAYSGGGLGNSLKKVLAAAGVHDGAGRCPRIQDFRHSFAVAALLRWYEEGADVQSNLPKLALYMGHVSIVSTAYYLRWMPAVVACASERFERACASVLEGGAS